MTPQSDKVIVGYFTSWSIYARDYQPSAVPYQHLTHINYAFINLLESSPGTYKLALGDSYADVEKAFPTDSWSDPPGTLRGNFNQFHLFRKQFPHIRIFASVGGWTWSKHFSDVASSSKSREAFAKSCLEFVTQYGFDGIDIDWEYPVEGGLESNSSRSSDKQNYTLLLECVRKELDKSQTTLGERFLLTICGPPGTAKPRNLELSKINGIVDWINVMAYDFHGSWDKLTGHNAPLFDNGDPSGPGLNVNDTMMCYRQGGMSAQKLVMGVPFYGRSWKGASQTKSKAVSSCPGVYLPSQGIGEGTWEPGVQDYRDTIHRYDQSHSHWDSAAKVPYIFDKSDGTFVSYENERSMAEKAAYIAKSGFKGAMIWELSGDLRGSDGCEKGGNGGLLKVLSRELNGNSGASLTESVIKTQISDNQSAKGELDSQLQQLSLDSSAKQSEATRPTPHEQVSSHVLREWDRESVYVGGDSVTFKGKTWRAGWWTRADEPGTTGEWGVWRAASSDESAPEYGDSSASEQKHVGGEGNRSYWDPQTAYTKGCVVKHGGRNWTAGWWTCGEVPGSTGQWGVWR